LIFCCLVTIVIGNNIFSEDTPNGISNTSKPTLTITKPTEHVLSPIEELELVVEIYLGSSNRDVQRLEYLYYICDDSCVIELKWSINNSLTEELRYLSAMKDIVDILKALSISNQSFEIVTLLGTFTLVDIYGNVTEETIIWATFTSEVIQKVQWETVLTDNFEYLAEEFIVHQAFMPIR